MPRNSAGSRRRTTCRAVATPRSAISPSPGRSIPRSPMARRIAPHRSPMLTSARQACSCPAPRTSVSPTFPQQRTMKSPSPAKRSSSISIRLSSPRPSRSLTNRTSSIRRARMASCSSTSTIPLARRSKEPSNSPSSSQKRSRGCDLVAASCRTEATVIVTSTWPRRERSRRGHAVSTRPTDPARRACIG